MKFSEDIVGSEGLQFFGKVSASISHEIKNSLAIINESAGLLQDLSAMADRGMPLDPARLQKVANTVQKQVLRADDIVKTMNRFAHSVDEPLREVELSQMVHLLVSIADRSARMKDIVIEALDSETHGRVKTYPFILENLIWRSLFYVMDAVGSDHHIRISIKNTERGSNVLISGLGEIVDAGTHNFPSETDEALAERLKADLEINTETGELIIALQDIVATEHDVFDM
jgi:C4-dicarboxylate-specific signal transduction histidine kinase